MGRVGCCSLEVDNKEDLLLDMKCGKSLKARKKIKTWQKVGNL